MFPVTDVWAIAEVVSRAPVKAVDNKSFFILLFSFLLVNNNSNFLIRIDVFLTFFDY
jgi:hypothetical protein